MKIGSKRQLQRSPRNEDRTGQGYGISFGHLQTDHWFDDYHEYYNSAPAIANYCGVDFAHFFSLWQLRLQLLLVFTMPTPSSTIVTIVLCMWPHLINVMCILRMDAGSIGYGGWLLQRARRGNLGGASEPRAGGMV